MKKMNRRLICSALLVVSATIGTASSGRAQVLIESLQASNYNASTGVWTDTSASADNATATGTKPTLVTNATPNGSSAVDFTGTLQTLQLGTTIGAQDVTIFAFVLPSANQSGGGDRGAIISGGGGGFEYGITDFNKYGNSKQNALKTSTADLGSSSTSVPTTTFSLIDISESLTLGGSYRLNVVDDGSVAASGAGAPFLTNIGSQDNGSEFFSGEIADIEVYSGTMTDVQRAAVESTLTAEYVTTIAAPEPNTWAMILGGLALLFIVQRKRFSKA
jgi:hypothetical protein